MLHIYLAFWAGFWRHVAEARPERGEAVKWIVQFGEVEKPLEDTHPDTGLPHLIAPVKQRMEERLAGADHRGLAIIFRIDPNRGLVHALRGPRTAIAKARQALSR